MDEIVEPAAPRTNIPEYSVGEIASAIKRALEEGFARVRVRGEISGFKRHGSGHLYFDIKDAEAVINGVCWRGVAARLDLKPEDGMEVICTGRVSSYARTSRYQLIVERIELAGEGALLKLIEERKRRLAAEGLFDAARKKPIPFLPEVIGVITSPTGAVIRDILHRLAERFPRHVLVWPVAVQGEGAAAQIAAAIAGFNALEPGGAVPRPDLLIVARGGGSLEDLMAFNEEIVVRAAAASRIPLIAAVGHETDTTLIDFAADLRCPTPTAAAEKAVPVRADLLAALLRDERRLVSALARLLEERRARVEGLGRGLGDPRRLIEEATQRVDDRAERLRLAAGNLVERLRGRVVEWGARLPHPRQQLAHARQGFDDRAGRLLAARAATLRLIADQLARDAELGARLLSAARRVHDDRAQRLAGMAQLLDSFSYARVLERGFVLVHDAAGAPVTQAAATRTGQALGLQFHDGTVGAAVTDSPGGGRKTAAPRAAAKQGSLL